MWFLLATHAGTTVKYGRKRKPFVWNIRQFYINQKSFLNLMCNKIPEEHWFYTQQIGGEWFDEKEGHVSDLGECPLILHFKEKCMILLKWCQCLQSILVITCFERKERIWKQFVTVQPSFPFPLTKVILTIDLSRAWMAFPSILGCHCCSQTELFNSVRQCCFRPRLLGKALKLLLYARSFYRTVWTVGLSAIPVLLVAH